MRIATVLVAEDEKTARLSLVALLEGEGFRVLVAENGTKALSMVLHGSQMPCCSTFGCQNWMAFQF